MAVGRFFLSFLSLILVAGALLLTILIFLGGAIDLPPTRSYFFLQADTSGIPNAPLSSRWTFWNICTNRNGHNDCPHVQPAFPLDPPSHRNFGTTTNIPSGFIGTHQYFYMTRFMFALALIAMFFAACSLFLGVFALCTRRGAKMAGFMCVIALIFQSATASLMTAAYVLGRNAFRKAGRSADIGNYAFGFEWGAWGCLFLATIFFCMGGRKKDAADTTGETGGIFRSKSTRSQGSFVPGKEYS